MNSVQVVGTHNSYHREMSKAEKSVFQQVKEDPTNYLYSHAALPDQFEYQSVRSLELDVYPDSQGGLYSTPLIRRMAGLSYPGDPSMNQSGVKVFHVADADVRSTCYTLIECLTQVRSWSQGNPGHVPIPIMLEFKSSEEQIEELGGVVSEPWETDALDGIDGEIRSVFEPEELITPDDLRRPDMSLEESVLEFGWPALREARGKVFFLMDNNPTNGSVRDFYRADGRESLQGRVIFTNSNPGEPDAAFLKRNDPLGDNLALIQSLVAQGYWVRTRADEPVEMVQKGNTAMRDAAFQSGAQIVSTDFPAVGLAARWDSNYVAMLSGAMVARCNPINAPSYCRDRTLE
ncbi:acid phosphatase [Lineolata rhizophorae]|uniref:Acid phosphatase n=1 Tax=Lineolata rhizophorae TaxID=578093 RepID=A0A6A6P0H3_9PEZI|nr:acid phosphatase [Lineolata rhizophorae]